MTDTGIPPLSFEAVSKWYGQVSALTDVTFHLRAEVVGLVGRNGAGKSTLLKLACGLLLPSQGLVSVFGEPTTAAATRARLGFAPDIERLYEGLTGRQFVAWMLRLHGRRAKAAWQRAGEVLDGLGLGTDMHRRIREYSKGMRQRVRLAQALAHEPEVVLLDEPMTGLDPVARHEVAEQIRSLAGRGVAVVVSSHVLHELENLVQNVLLIHQGRLMAEGAVGELRRQLDGRPHRLFLGSRRPRELAGQVARMEQISGLRVVDRGVEIETSGQAGVYGELTALGARDVGLLDELTPMDDSLASVFGYLVG